MESNSPPLACTEKMQGGLEGRPPDVLYNVAEPNLRESCIATGSQPASPMTELPLKKKAGLIRLIDAPQIDLTEARKQFEEEGNDDDDEEGQKDEANHFGRFNEDISESNDLESPKVLTHDAEYLDAANEETFTLETFEALIRAARAANKAFLLARVTTVDPKNLTRLYYSYYSAYQINKVIFRTQPEEGLLHRMRSKNPLNNMPIVGDVHYFAIAPIDFDVAWQAREAHQERKRVLRTSVSSPLALRRLQQIPDASIPVEEDQGPAMLERQNPLNHNNDNNDGGFGIESRNQLATDQISLRGFDAQRREGLDPVKENLVRLSISTTPNASPQLGQIDLNGLDGLCDDALPVIYVARYFASDDDFLMRSDVRDFFKKNSINPEDYLLFPLNRPTGHGYEMMMIMGADGRPQFRGTHPVPASHQGHTRTRPGARYLWGILDDGSHRSMVGCLPMGFLSPLGFWLIVIIGSAVGVFCGLVYVPTPWCFVVFIGMLAFYVLLMLFFVNWEDVRRRIRATQAPPIVEEPVATATTGNTDTFENVPRR